jgi:hypothetical protein
MDRLVDDLTTGASVPNGGRPSPAELGPLTPELVLVAPPELARLARELLPDLPRSYRERLGEVLPLPPPAVVGESAPRRGLMDASLEPPYALGEIVRGGLALAVAAALFAAAAFAADRSAARRTTGSRAPVAAAAPASAGVAGISTAGGVGVAGEAPHQAAPKSPQPTRAPAQTARPSTTVASGPLPRHVTSATGSGAPVPGATTRQGSTTAKSRRAGPALSPSPAIGGSFVPSRVFAWASATGARAYDVRFFLDGKPVLRLRTAAPQLTLPASFRFRAGVYRWRVTPLLASGRRGAAIVDSAFRLTASTAAQANRAG